MVLQGFEERGDDGSSGDRRYEGAGGDAGGRVHKQELREATPRGSGHWLLSMLWHSRRLQVVSVPYGNVAGHSSLLLLWKLLPVTVGVSDCI